MSKIAVAGTILVDNINEISAYPKAGELTKIRSLKRAVGGCVPNVATDLKTLSPDSEICAAGMVGDDEDGRFVLHELSSRGVDTSGIRVGKERTSFTEVMSVEGGERTFFTYAGANDVFAKEHVDLSALGADMLHLGYFLLLGKMDGGDGLKLLADAKSRGIKTSVDFVSENSDRYSAVRDCLAYTDNLIVNELEAGKLAGLPPVKENLREIARAIKDMGVSERVIIHMPEMSLCLSSRGITCVPSFALEQGFIKGTTGAGDAFCAGALLSVSRGATDEEILSFASMSAVAALSEADAVSGLKSESEVRKMCEKMERKKLCL